MPIPFLPKIKKDSKDVIITQRGIWRSLPVEILQIISDSCDISIDDECVGVNYIPEIWSRPILFQIALYDENHALHKSIRNEWRGLLAVLALDLFSYDVECREVLLSNNIGEMSFIETLKRSIPSETIFSDTRWQNLYTIKYRNTLVGMTSPTTLVCTASDYADYEYQDQNRNLIKVKMEGIRWFNGRTFNDPIKYLNKIEKRALKYWLDSLKNNVLSWANRMNEAICGKLVSQINRFQVDIGENIKKYPTGRRNLGMKIGIFKILNESVIAEELSNVEIIPSKDKEPKLRLLIYDEDIPSQWNKKAHEIHIAGGFTIADIPNNTEIDIEKLYNFILWSKNDLFTDKLYAVRQENPFPGALLSDKAKNLPFASSIITPILPIKEGILDYLNSEELSQRVNFNMENEEIIVHLRLTLSGFDNGSKDVLISKRYEKDQIAIIDDMPALEIWPNFAIDMEADKKSGKWSLYYTYCSCSSEPDRTFYAMPHSPSGEIKSRLFSDNKNRVMRGVIKTNVFPEAIICGHYSKNSEGEGKINTLFGLLPLGKPKTVYPKQQRRDIGVDFGTTNTSIYIRRQKEIPTPMIFKKEFLLQVTAPGSRRSLLYDEFLPGENIETPFLSFYQNFGKIRPNIQALIDGHIFFLDTEKQFKADDADIKTDLKWSEDPNDRFCLNTFLEQICLQCLAEAASNGVDEVVWHFSFPTSFSMNDLQSFENTWSKLAKSLSEATGIVQSVATARPESIAAAQYFAVNEIIDAPIGVGIICIDIGGGSTDISVWKEAELIHQVSLRFAGRDIFLEPIRKNPDFLETFVTNIGNLKDIKEKKLPFYAQVDALIKASGSQWLEKINKEPEIKNNSEMRGFIQIIAIGLAGIYYYIGLILKKYLSQLDSPRIPNIYIAGNGARIFDWVANGKYSKNSQINNLFKIMLMKASGINTTSKNFEVKPSDRPKAEVAYALASENIPLSYKREQLIGGEAIAGDAFEINNNKYSWDQVITSEDMAKGIKILDKMEHLKTFIALFDEYVVSTNSMVKIPIKPDEKLFSHIYDKVCDRLARISKTQADTIRVESLFIMELKALLDVKINEWSEDIQ